jgi:anti-anti-sigma regulatory factor
MQQTTWAAHDYDDCTIVTITGEGSLITALDVLASFRSVCGARRRIIVDPTCVTFIDSIGAGRVN